MIAAVQITFPLFPGAENICMFFVVVDAVARNVFSEVIATEGL